MEFFLSLRFKKFVREHKEDPWDWLRLGTKEIKKTRRKKTPAPIYLTLR
jgi:hypothetical protein